jgi:4-hydroxy-3-methylbut-2-en-1-yl diphosphate synthase IspG/GcpE
MNNMQSILSKTDSYKEAVSSTKQLILSVVLLPDIDYIDNLTAHGAETNTTDIINCRICPGNDIQNMSLKEDISKLLSSSTFVLFVLGKVMMFIV